ncbi:MAG: PilN domain-containing protein [Syntrophorhabdaceae bacterium]|nr:PilN domain-containing protein [Syntrophorhabdaceae bacterium]
MIKINLLPGKAKKDFLKLDLFIFFFIMFIALLTAGGIYYLNVKEINSYEKRIDETKKQIASLNSIYNEYLAMEAEKKEIRRRIKAIDTIKEGRGLSARILSDLSDTVKDNVWLKYFKKTEKTFELLGHSLESESISSFVEGLSKLPYIKNVELKNVENTVEEGVQIKRFAVYGEISL